MRPTTADILWEQAFPSGQPHCSQPVAVADDLVLVSSGYGIGSKLFRISPGEDGKYRSETVWESRGLKTKFTNTVLHKGSIYGLDEGILVCLDPETGRRRWKRGRYGHGQLILVGDLLLITSEQGEVALVEANPERYQEVAPLPGPRGNHLEHPSPQRRPPPGQKPPASRRLQTSRGTVTRRFPWADARVPWADAHGYVLSPRSRLSGSLAHAAFLRMSYGLALEFGLPCLLTPRSRLNSPTRHFPMAPPGLLPWAYLK